MAWDPFPRDRSLLYQSFALNRQNTNVSRQKLIGLAKGYHANRERQTGVEACVSTGSVNHGLE
jgi:hypothetical protein